MLPLILAGALAAAPLDAPHAAVLTVLQWQRESLACDPATLREMAAKAEIRTLGRAGGDPVVLALVASPCICGTQNCPYYGIRLGAGRPRVLFEAFGFAVRVVGSASALPNVVVAAHDSAAVIDETTFAFRDGTYTSARTERVRVGDEARKPDSVPVRFAFGASSAPLRGRVALGWYDAYTFAAERGQHLTVTATRPRAPVTLTLFGPGAGDTSGLRLGVPFALPRSGTYRLHVEGTSSDDAAYALTLAIR